MNRRTPIALTLAAAALGAQAAPAADTQQLAANKKTVLDFYEKALNQGRFDDAAVHFGPRYVQHNPMIKDGAEGFRGFLQQLKQRFPQAHGDIRQVFAEGDFVILHVQAKREPAEAGIAIVDIFRLEAGKIVEHWDVRQPMPEASENSNGMF